MGTLAAKPPYAVLCEQGPWMWHEWYSLYVKFNADGRGELSWLVEHEWVLVVIFDWEITADAIAEEGVSRESEARLLGNYDMTMKLNRSTPHGHHNWVGNLDRHYTSNAYEPKHFKVTIEQGTFRSPMRAGGEVQDLRRANGTESRGSKSFRGWDWSAAFVPERENLAERWRYGHRLVFDKSPYPPVEDWARPFDPRMISTDPEPKVEFVAQLLPKSEYGKHAMNEAWQREMVRIWEARPLNEAFLEHKRIVEAERERHSRFRARLEEKKARERAKRKEEEEEEEEEEAEATEQARLERAQ